jgi:hypothetical protein
VTEDQYGFLVGVELVAHLVKASAAPTLPRLLPSARRCGHESS